MRAYGHAGRVGEVLPKGNEAPLGYAALRVRREHTEGRSLDAEEGKGGGWPCP